MTEQEVVLAQLRQAGILNAVAWAYRSASDRLLLEYSEGAGHNTTWIGQNRYTYFVDRLDRVFSCRRYKVPQDLLGAPDMDVVFEELSDRDKATFPALEPTAIERIDLDGSPGWVHQDVRLMLKSIEYGQLDAIRWSQASPVMQKVARQVNLDAPSLFDEDMDEESGFLRAVLERELDLRTFVISHTVDAEEGNRELVLGSPRSNPKGGDPWYWKIDILDDAPTEANRVRGGGQPPASPDSTPDAAVTLRGAADAQQSK